MFREIFLVEVQTIALPKLCDTLSKLHLFWTTAEKEFLGASFASSTSITVIDSIIYLSPFQTTCIVNIVISGSRPFK